MGFNTVMIYPQSGFRYRPWDANPDNDALLRTSRSVCERYSEALEGADIAHRPAKLVLKCAEESSTGSDVISVFDREGIRRPSFEGGTIAAPSGFALWDTASRRRSILDGIHSCCLELASVVGFDRSPFDTAHAHTARFNGKYDWTSPWRLSPGRSWRARCLFELKSDGYGRVRVEFEDVKTGKSATSRPLWAPTLGTSFRRSAKSFKWFTKDSVAFVPFCGKIAPIMGDEHYIGVRELADGAIHLDEGPEPHVPFFDADPAPSLDSVYQPED